MERDAGELDGEEERRAGIYGRREKRRGSAVHAFPDQAAAKLKGVNRTTEITKLTILFITLLWHTFEGLRYLRSVPLALADRGSKATIKYRILSALRAKRAAYHHA
jgi:hypothetical protein